MHSTASTSPSLPTRDAHSPITVFASDLHVADKYPANTSACVRLLRLCQQAEAVGAVYLLGDLFDLWLGDDDNREPHLEIENALRALVDAGTPVYVQRGNHDLLLGKSFVTRTQVELLPDEHCITLGGERVLLMHGDLLCTDDVEYLAFRATAHEPAQQAQFLALPLAQRVAVAADLRNRSRSHTTTSASNIMDVTPAAVEAALTRHEATILVHGHTHRPARHQLATPSGPRVRHVLSDWHKPPAVLVHENGEFRTLELDELAQELGS